MKAIRKESLSYLLIYSIIGAVVTVITIALFSMQLRHSYNQFSYLKGSEFNYIYETNDKINKNSYKYYDNYKSFYLDSNLKNKINAKSLMELQVLYDDNNFITSNNMVTGIKNGISANEIIINKDISIKYNIHINDIVYSKSVIHQETYEYKVVGISKPFYNFEKYEYHLSSGFVIFGYDEEEDFNTNYKYINFSKEDPTNIILENNTSLNKLHNLRKNIQDSRLLFIQNLTLMLTLNLVVYLILLIYITKDLSSYVTRLYLVGNKRKAIEVIALRIVLFYLITIIIYAFLLIVYNSIFKLSFFSMNFLSIIMTYLLISIIMLIFEFTYKSKRGVLIWKK